MSELEEFNKWLEDQHAMRKSEHQKCIERIEVVFAQSAWMACSERKQREIDELAAQVSKAKEFIQMLANSSPADDMDSTPFDAQEFLDSFPTGPDALREIQARTLPCNLTCEHKGNGGMCGQCFD